MERLDEVIRALEEGRFWEAGAALAADRDADYALLARTIAEAVADKLELLDLVEDLAFPPPPPPGADKRARLVCAEAMRLLAVGLARGLAETNWQDLVHIVKAISGPENSYRVQEALVGLLEAVATTSFAEARSFLVDCLEEGAGELAAATARALALSSVPVGKVLELLEVAVHDSRTAVRNAMSRQAVGDLARRDAQAVLTRLREWATSDSEITRWNVAKALSTSAGGASVERAIDILEIFAADTRPMVWRAAAEALAQAAQRRPAYVLPILARWREDPKRWRCAELALEHLARR